MPETEEAQASAMEQDAASLETARLAKNGEQPDETGNTGAAPDVGEAQQSPEKVENMAQETGHTAPSAISVSDFVRSEVRAETNGIRIELAEQFGKVNEMLAERFNKQDAAIAEQFRKHDVALADRFSKQDVAIAEQFGKQNVAIAEQFRKQDMALAERFSKQDATIAEQFRKQDAALAERFSKHDVALAEQFGKQNTEIAKMGETLEARARNMQGWLITTMIAGGILATGILALVMAYLSSL